MVLGLLVGRRVTGWGVAGGAREGLGTAESLVLGIAEPTRALGLVWEATNSTNDVDYSFFLGFSSVW